MWLFFRFFFSQNNDNLSSWTCYTRVWTTHKEYLLAFVTVRSFAGFSFDIVRVRLEMRSYPRPPPTHTQIGVLRYFTPIWGAVST